MRKIIHCDADCFFAAVEMRDNPALRETPMAVGGSSQGRGVISTCNYAARRFGVRSAMATKQALALCPGLVLMPHAMDKYRRASAAMAGIFHDYSDLVEMASLDEAYLDVSASDHCGGSATRIAEAIRARVRAEVGITVSAGVATSKFLAKVASEWRKPDGLFVVHPAEEQAFIRHLAVKNIHGVGKVTAARLAGLGIVTCGDLEHWSLAELIKKFGAFGVRLHDLARGIDKRPVTSQRARKSLSVEHTFSTDLAAGADCSAQVTQLYGELLTRLGTLSSDYQLRKIQVKIKFSDFSQTTLETPATSPRITAFSQLIREGLERHSLPVRLLGIGVQFAPRETGLISDQLPLFGGGTSPAPAIRHHQDSGFQSLAQ